MPAWQKVVASVVLASLTCFGLARCEFAVPKSSAPPDGRSVRFTAAGDVGMGKGAKAVLDTIKELGPDFNVNLGDLSYAQGPEQAFCDLITAKLGPDFPYEVVAGNHESNGEEGHIENFANCLPNKLPGLQGEYGKQWYVDVPQEHPLVRLILVSPGLEFPEGVLDYSRDSERWRWTESAIDGARTADIPWTVVGMHTPCFSIGNYGCDAGQALTNLLISKNVDLVLTGHEHIYQRTHQLGINRTCIYLFIRDVTPECVVDSDDALTKGKGTVFTTIGVGGKSIREINTDDPEKPYFDVWSGTNENPALGTLDVTVTSTRMDVRFVPATGYTFTDAFSIGK